MTSTTRTRVCGATGPVPSLSTRETTATDTPASRATSRIVAALRTGAPFVRGQPTDGLNRFLTCDPRHWYKTVTVTTAATADSGRRHAPDTKGNREPPP